MIEIKDLTYSYGQKTVLSHLDLTIEAGQFYALLGANGCGKTTLLRCIGGLLQPQQGNITLQGEPLLQYPIHQRAQKISFVHQHAVSQPDFCAFDIVLMGRNPYQRKLQNESKHDRDIVEKSMKQTGTWHLREAHPNEMSGGELQRVMIARALAQTTPIMLLDEPTSNLDIAHQLEIMRLLSQLNQEEHKTIILVVHDLNLALQYCPKSVFLNQGRVFAHGDTCQVLTPENIKAVYNVNATLLGDSLRFSL